MFMAIQKPRPRTSRSRQRVISKPNEGCWVHIYPQAFFGGKVRRVVGPCVFRQTTGDQALGSIIVGPGARLVSIAGPRGKSLSLKRVVPEVRKSPLGDEAEGFEIVRAE